MTTEPPPPAQPFELESPRLEILRDLYQTMNRRLEHYRQLATGTVFGLLAVFILANNAITAWRKDLPAVRPQLILDRLALLFDLLIVYAIVLLIVFFGTWLIRRSARNFREVSSTILKIELIFRLHNPGEFIANDTLLPGDWPHLDPGNPWTSTGQWVEDIIPITQRIVIGIGIFFTFYVGYLAIRLLCK
jgi:hypothetical protein